MLLYRLATRSHRGHVAALAFRARVSRATSSSICIARLSLANLCLLLAPTAFADAQDAPTRRGVFAPPVAEERSEPVDDRAPLDPAWIGGWLGAAKLMGGEGASTELPFVIAVRANVGAPSVTVWSIPAGAVAAAATEVEPDGRTLRFTLASQGGSGRFEVSLADGDQSSSGRLTMGAPQRRPDLDDPNTPVARVTLKRVDLVTELPESRVFAGTLDAGAQKLPMRLAVGEGPNGWCGALDILVQGIRDFPVPVERTDTGLTVRFSAGVVAVLELTSVLDPAAPGQWVALEGTFRQGAFAAPIRLELDEGIRAGALRRPQEPKPPFPYEIKEVTVPHPLGHTLAGTLTIPSSSTLTKDGRVPAVVCVSGSGPQDRDETIMGHKPFAVLADALTRAGVAVLRYDDRGTAASTGQFNGATTTDLASDADIAAEWLKRQPGIDPTRVGLVGHSEGGLIGPLVATWQNVGDSPANPLAFLVLIAPPGEVGGRVLTRQTRALAEAAGITPDQLDSIVRAHQALMDEVIAGRAADTIRPAITDLLRAQFAASGQPPTDDASLRPLVEQTLLSLTSPWMSEFIRLDPRAALLRLEIPTLAVLGTLDLQVDATTNAAIFEDAAKVGGAPITVRTYERLNHLLQPATKGTVEEYGEIEWTMDPRALEEIVAWVVETARSAPSQQIPESTRPQQVRDAYVPPRLFEFRPQSGVGESSKSDNASPDSQRPTDETETPTP